MTIDVFMSYASEDRERVRPLVDALKARGWSVWWDREVIPGDGFEARIEQALADARCVVVVWTAASAASEWVHAEAHDGLDRHVLVPLMLERVRLPLAFRHKDAAQLFDWRGDPGHPEFPRLVRAIEGTLAGRAVEPEFRPPAEPKASTRTRWWLVGAIVASIAIFAAWWLTDRRDEGVAVPQNSLAVLRFVNLGSPADDYRSVGLSIELLDLLTRLHELQVAAQISSFAARGDAAEIRRQLLVRYVVEGSYRQDDDGIAVEAQLVDTQTGYRLWSESIKGGADALVDAPLVIARRVVTSLDVTLSDESLQQLRTAPTANVQALDRYLSGNELLRAPVDAETLAAAEKAFLDAVALDPSFAMPYAGLCRVHLIQYQRGLDVERFTAAEDNCRRTLSLNAVQADPYKALGDLYLASGRLDDAQAQYETAKRLSSRDAEAVIGLAQVAVRRGNTLDAEREFRHAVALEPHYWRTHGALGGFLFGSGRFDEAVAEYERLTELDATHLDAWGNLGSARYMQGDVDGALGAWQKALGLAPGAIEYANVGTAYFFLGRYAEAVDMYERASALEPKDHRVWGGLGDARQMLGQIDAAKAAYETAADLARQNLSIDSDDVETRVLLAGYDARLGRDDLAKRALADAMRLTPADLYLYYDAAVAYTRLRMPDDALQALAIAVEQGYPRHLVAIDPQFESLRTLERFSAIAR
ncbi:MAG TPA: TIR domain-containing protein [Pseudomonadales bacterium]